MTNTGEDRALAALRMALAERLCDPGAPDPVGKIGAALARQTWALPVTADTSAPVCANIPGVAALCAQSADGSLATLLATVLTRLRWVADYPDKPALAETFGHAVLHSGDGLVIGCNLLAVDTAYPSHAHLADELYLPVSDGMPALWRQGDGVDREKHAGTLVIHASEEPHALTTRADPILNIWLQFGQQPGGPAWFV